MQKELECIVSGRVHGVGYRLFIQDKARDLNIFGYVTNLSDGTVEIVAQGEEGILKKFLEQVKRGPVFSAIRDVEITWHDRAQDSFDDFSII